MSSVYDHIRSFGMSGFMLTDELRKVEEEFSVTLGHTARDVTASPIEYYPQFEQSVRSEAEEMSCHYEVFYCLEKAIRKLISETLQDAEGVTWWDSGRIPQNVIQEVKDRIQKELDSGVTRRSDAPIDYTTFGEL